MNTRSRERMECMRRHATDAADLLRQLGNASRFMLLCEIARGETTVAQLERSVGIGQPALSQHLAELRKGGLVRTRRESRSVHYSIADARALMLVESLARVFHVQDEPVAALSMPTAVVGVTRAAAVPRGDVAQFATILGLRA